MNAASIWDMAPGSRWSKRRARSAFRAPIWIISSSSHRETRRLTRRSGKYSTLSAVVLKWSRARKHYERQGLLVEESALQARQFFLKEAAVI